MTIKFIAQKKWANTKWDGKSGLCDVHMVYTAETAVDANYVVIRLSSCQKNKSKFDLKASQT